jgi:hypothetical protein
MGGVRVGEELGDDGGFRDDFSVVGERWHEAAWVDGQVFGCAGDGEVNLGFVNGGTNAEYGAEYVLCTVSNSMPSSLTAIWAR